MFSLRSKKNHLAVFFLCIILALISHLYAQDYSGFHSRAFSPPEIDLRLRTALQERASLALKHSKANLAFTEIWGEILELHILLYEIVDNQDEIEKLLGLRTRFYEAQGDLLDSRRFLDLIDQEIQELLAGTVLVGQDGVFLGEVVSEYHSNSIFKPWGDYGSSYSQTSIWNSSSKYGSSSNSYSAFCLYASEPPLIIRNGVPVAIVTLASFYNHQLQISPRILQQIFNKDDLEQKYQEKEELIEDIFDKWLRN